MIKQFLETGLVNFQERFDTWEEAVVASGDKMVEQGYIDERYVKSIVANIHEHGPYIVIVPGIAMPHSTHAGEGVYKTGISFMRVKEPVYFDDEKYATLFFTLAAVDDEAHLGNMTRLMELLLDEEAVEMMHAAESIEDLEKISREKNL